MTQTVEFKGKPTSVAGQIPQPGHQAHDFKLVAVDLSDVTLNDNFAGKRKVLNIFPSVDTGTCAASVRQFNQSAVELKNTVVLCISADLPFAQSRFCGAEGLKNVTMLSTLRGGDEFKKEYGVGISSGPLTGLTARAVIVLDELNKVIYSEIVEEISVEPKYDAALATLK